MKCPRCGGTEIMFIIDAGNAPVDSDGTVRWVDGNIDGRYMCNAENCGYDGDEQAFTPVAGADEQTRPVAGALECPKCSGSDIRGVYEERGECSINHDGNAVADGNEKMQDFTVTSYVCRDCQHESKFIADFNPKTPKLQCPKCGKRDTVVTAHMESHWMYVDQNGDTTGAEYGDPGIVESEDHGNDFFCPYCEFRSENIEDFITKQEGGE